MILVIDNYDSFVHNIARYFTMLGAVTEVARNDALSLADIRRLAPEAIVISPGPCTPAEAGISCGVLESFSGIVPILGVCLGHQCMGTVFGGRVARAARPMHGLAAPVTHNGSRLFAGLPNPLPAGRYHSLIVETTPAMATVLEIDARSPEGEIMALSHRRHPTYGVQFHPESVLTPSGAMLLGRFLALATAFNARTPTAHAMA